MCEETVKKAGETSQRGQDGLRLRKKDPSPRRRSLSPAPYPGSKPITTGLYLEPHHLAGKLYRAHHTIQIPVYFVKWILGQFLAIISFFCWRLPNCDDDIIEVVEGTSMIIVLRRDFETEAAEKAAFSSLPGCTIEGAVPLMETRHYYIDVKRCELDLLIREPGSTYKSGKGKSTLLKSWSMRYTKTRRREGLGGGQPGYNKNGEGSTKGKWTNKVLSFVINGKNIYEREKMYALLFQYHTAGTHTKSHVMGNALADRILLDDRVRDKLSESTWTTTALHYGLIYGTSGPMSDPRHEGNQWMGLGTIPTCASLLAEADNMTALGANHADKDHWTDLGLPFADFLLNVRVVLTKVMKNNDIPPDLHEGIFLSCVMHACDHVLLHRVMYGKVFNPDPHGIPGTWYDHYESCCWRYMWVEPTLNPFWNNKIWRMRKPFYRQLYLGIKEIDTFNVSGCITASIMY